MHHILINDLQTKNAKLVAIALSTEIEIVNSVNAFYDGEVFPHSNVMHRASSPVYSKCDIEAAAASMHRRRRRHNSQSCRLVCDRPPTSKKSCDSAILDNTKVGK